MRHSECDRQGSPAPPCPGVDGAEAQAAIPRSIQATTVRTPGAYPEGFMPGGFRFSRHGSRLGPARLWPVGSKKDPKGRRGSNMARLYAFEAASRDSAE